MIAFTNIDPKIREQLNQFPPRSAYHLKPGGKSKKPYLPIEYYEWTANKIFGIGNWGLSCVETPIYERRTHPTTGKFLGDLVIMTVTLRVNGFAEITQTRSAPVNFSKEGNSISEYQDISNSENAINIAAARAAKACFSLLGPVFMNDYEGKKETYWKQFNNSEEPAKPLHLKVVPPKDEPEETQPPAKPKTVYMTPTQRQKIEELVRQVGQETDWVTEAQFFQDFGSPSLWTLHLNEAAHTIKRLEAYKLLFDLLASVGKTDRVVTGSSSFQSYGITHILDLTSEQFENYYQMIEKKFGNKTATA